MVVSPKIYQKERKHQLMKIIIFVASYMLLAASLHAQTVKELQAEIVSLQILVNAQQAQITSLKKSTVQALAPYVSVSQAVQNGVVGPNITFTGANIHIVDDTNLTNFTNGTGNFLIGYDEPPTAQVGYTRFRQEAGSGRTTSSSGATMSSR
jgi:hypothetical protein